MFKHLTRRELGRVALSGALAATAPNWSRSSSAQDPIAPGVKLRCQAPENPTDEDLLFFRQLGVDSVNVHGDAGGDKSLERMLNLKRRFADAGLVVDKFDGPTDDLLPDILLNRPGRDAAIETYKTWVRTLAKGGFKYLPEMFDLVGAAQSGRVEERGSVGRDCDLNSPELSGPMIKGGAKGPATFLLFGREYGREEMWANYTLFIKEIAPVAEEAGILIGFHPDDPPVPTLFGMARLFSNFEDCKKALKIANSPNVGMCLCIGTWAEGGAKMGIDPAGAIRYFASQKQLFEIHFRNVSSTLPHFHETYPDDGYYDMYEVMKALDDVKYDGAVQMDHIIPMVGDGGHSNIPAGRRTFEAFAIGYMRALQQRAHRARG